MFGNYNMYGRHNTETDKEASQTVRRCVLRALFSRRCYSATAEQPEARRTDSKKEKEREKHIHILQSYFIHREKDRNGKGDGKEAPELCHLLVLD